MNEYAYIGGGAYEGTDWSSEDFGICKKGHLKVTRNQTNQVW